MKQSIVKEAKMSEYNGKKSYTVTFEDGITGYYDAKTIGELKRGDLVEYHAEEKTNKKGGKYNLLTVTKGVAEEKPVPPPSKTPSSPEPVKDAYWQKMKYETRVPIARIIMDAVIAGKIETSQDEFKSWYNALTGEIDASIDVLQG